MRIFGPFMRILSVRSMFPRQGGKEFYSFEYDEKWLEKGNLPHRHARL